MRKRKLNLSDLVPVGADAKAQIRRILVALTVSALWSLQALFRILRQFQDLKTARELGVRVYCLPFRQLLGSAFYGFALLGLVLLGAAGWNYAALRRGARTDLLLRRLRDPWELHRRCLTVPLLGIFACILVGLALFAAYRAAYWRQFLKAAAGMEDPMGLVIKDGGAPWRWRGIWG